jgi:peroxiredoxin
VNSAFYVSYGLLWALLLFQSVLLIGVTQKVYRLPGARPAESPELPSSGALSGQPMPSFAATDLSGRAIESHEFLGKATTIIFVSPSCSSCAVTLDELAVLSERVDGSVLVVCRSSPGRCRRIRELYGIDVPVVPDREFRISRLFGVTTVPTAVIVDDDGVVQRYGHPRRGDELVQIFDHDEAELAVGASANATPEQTASTKGGDR